MLATGAAASAAAADGKAAPPAPAPHRPARGPRRRVGARNGAHSAAGGAAGWEDDAVGSVAPQPYTVVSDGEESEEDEREGGASAARAESRAAATAWARAAAAGAGTAAIAFAVNLATQHMAALKLAAVLRAAPDSLALSFAIYAGVNSVLVTAAAALTAALSPAAAGSGIPDLKACLDGCRERQFTHHGGAVFSRRALAAKAAGAAAAVAGGLSVGKEGPFVHVGACVAAAVADATRLRSSSSRRADLLAAGGAAGVAAAFRAPLGGVLFALEEAASGRAPPRRLPLCLMASTAAAAVLRVASAACAKRPACAAAGLLRGAVFALPSADGDANSSGAEYLMTPRFGAAALALGVAGGAAGAAFTAVLRGASVARRRRTPLDAAFASLLRRAVAEAAAVSLLTSAACFAAPLAFACVPCPPAAAAAGMCPSRPAAGAATAFPAFRCGAATSASHYSPPAALFLATPEAAVRALLSPQHAAGAFSPAVLLFFFWASLVLTTAAYGLLLPAGLFVPLIAAGAAAGRATAFFAAPSRAAEHPVYALLGAAGLLGGAMRCPLSLCAILLELTDALQLLPLLLLALLASSATGAALSGGAGHGLYDLLARDVKRAPMLPPAPPCAASAAGVTAGALAQRCCVTLRARERPERVHAALRALATGAPPPLVLLPAARRSVDEASDSDSDSLEDDDHGADCVAPPLLLGALRPRAAAAALRAATRSGARRVELAVAASRSRPLLVREGTSLGELHALFAALRPSRVAVVPAATPLLGTVSRERLLAALRPQLASAHEDDAGRRNESGGGPASVAARRARAEDAA